MLVNSFILNVMLPVLPSPWPQSRDRYGQGMPRGVESRDGLWRVVPGGVWTSMRRGAAGADSTSDGPASFSPDRRRSTVRTRTRQFRRHEDRPSTRNFEKACRRTVRRMGRTVKVKHPRRRTKANGAAPFGTAPPREARGFSKLRLTDVGRLQALRAANDVEFQPLALGKSLEALARDRGVVDEHVLATLLLNEPKALRFVEPLHGS